MIPKQFDDITFEDIEALAAGMVEERVDLDYKAELPPSWNDEAKKELRADVCSFANTQGGDLIYGVRDQRDEDGAMGIPEEKIGMEVKVEPQLLRIMEAILNDCIEPRISGLRLKTLEKDGRFVLIIRTNRSWAAPHRTTFKDWSRFVARNTKGKYTMTMREIRESIEFGASLKERIDAFRTARLNILGQRLTPVPLQASPMCVIHLHPLSAADPYSPLDVAQTAHGLAFPNGQKSKRFNFDGLLAFEPLGKAPVSRSYTQVFRNGIVESTFCCRAFKYSPHDPAPEIGSSPTDWIDSRSFESTTRELVMELAKILQALEIAPPLVLSVSLLGASAHGIANEAGPAGSNMHSAIGMFNMTPPSVIVDNWDFNRDKLLKPVFDVAWQACGASGSQHYDPDTGEWREVVPTFRRLGRLN